MEAPREALRADVLSQGEKAWTDLEWMERHVGALFVHDRQGRVTALAGASPEPAPRFFLGRTRLGNLWRFRSDLSWQVVIELARLAGREPAPVDLDEPPQRLPAMRARLEADAAVEQETFGAAFRFPEALPDPGETEALGSEDAERICAAFPRLAARVADRQPCCAVYEAGAPRAVCFAASRGGGAVEARVETLPGFRGRGLASRALVAWARAVRGGGEQPLYAVELSNRAGLGVARRLGLIRFGSDLRIR